MKWNQTMLIRKRSWLRNDLTLQVIRCINTEFGYFQVKTQKFFLQIEVSLSDGCVGRASDLEIIEASVELHHLACVPWHAYFLYAQRLERQNLELWNAVLDDWENSLEHLWEWCGEERVSERVVKIHLVKEKTFKAVVSVWFTSSAGLQPCSCR